MSEGRPLPWGTSAGQHFRELAYHPPPLLLCRVELGGREEFGGRDSSNFHSLSFDGQEEVWICLKTNEYLHIYILLEFYLVTRETIPWAKREDIELQPKRLGTLMSPPGFNSHKYKQ